ncbi:MerR family transcriptional regulator [Enterococcus pallens]|uniref:HTH merR-type domain-containing protein n=1 Tax=Enterococcus pallens ATCC BAA-351 TaxID=1158607 RepID=R2SRS0_9ENTE|nr:MerR family transcriptional regulator [Enterococcus pallens]EOH97945.1 hypothetical protein UAU_00613 [Enterococcus pallens ATCC BAA-351]EOU20636.1 hypothetical protein I588_01483 [Enterococcus pallens ATCC BAA-351]OJG80337.1 hypothetical protein RV10_GL004549 [Enterococcus pallens]
MTYSIGTFSELTGFSIDTIRYYEKQGIILTKRDLNNRRIFDEKDVEWLVFIRKLKQTGMKWLNFYCSFMIAEKLLALSIGIPSPLK